MGILVSDIITRASRTLLDIGLVRWTEAEMIDSINDAEAAVLEARPDLFEITAFHDLVEGPKQTPPSDCYMLLDVAYNVNQSDTPQSVVTFVKRKDLDMCLSDWMLDDPMTHAAHWMQDDRERRQFYVYPRQPTPPAQLGRVMLRYAQFPTKVTATTDTLTVGDEMVNPIYYFTVMRMLERDEKFSGSPQARRFMELFAMTMGVRTEGEDAATANRARTEG
jgi:hypothetical protein